MEYQSPDQFHVVVAGSGGDMEYQVEAELVRVGYHAHQVSLDLEGLSRVAGIKPNAIVLVGLDPLREDWVLHFVEDNPRAPAVVAVCEPSVLATPPCWLYDTVQENEIATALHHRLNRALSFGDLKTLTAERTQKLGLSRAQIGLLSMIDMVTGLFNRRYFTKHLRESFAAATRYERPLTCLLVRVDNLGTLVRELGRELANDVLDTMAQTLVTVIRRADTMARIDDDLFGFLLPETTAEGGNWLAPRLIGRLQRVEFPYDARLVFSTALAQLSENHESPESLLHDAMSKLPEPR